MEKNLPTAEEFYKQTTGCVMNHRDIKAAMIEFAKLHVEAALKEASKKAKIDIGKRYTADEITLHPTSIIRTVVIKADRDSILNSYPTSNIK